jgi:hypothetical protein
MHEVQIEVDLGSATSAKAVLKSSIVVAVVALVSEEKYGLALW